MVFLHAQIRDEYVYILNKQDISDTVSFEMDNGCPNMAAAWKHY